MGPRTGPRRHREARSAPAVTPGAPVISRRRESVVTVGGPLTEALQRRRSRGPARRRSRSAADSRWPAADRARPPTGARRTRARSPQASPPRKPPAWAKLFTLAMKKPNTKRIRAHIPYWRSTMAPKAPPRRRPYATMAPSRPKIEPEAPTVRGMPTALDTSEAGHAGDREDDRRARRSVQLLDGRARAGGSRGD